MSRQKLFVTLPVEKFRHRNREILRIEALSDAVFAFSVSLLAVSLEVPQTFEELTVTVKGAIPFLATVSMLFLFWYQQYIFFRRYGLNDLVTILLNMGYLAVILFYVYPLKFLFSVLLGSWTGMNLFPKATEKGLQVLSEQDFPELIILFSTGYLVIWVLVYLLHKRALRFTHMLELNSYEVIFTHKEIRGALWNALVGLLALCLAKTGNTLYAGVCYLLIPVVLVINRQVFKWQLKTTQRK